MESGKIAFLISLAIWLITLSWCIYAMTVFWKFRYDLMIAKRRPRLTIFVISSLLVAGSTRWLTFAISLWPKEMSWFTSREVELIVYQSVVIPLGILLIKTWLCYFDWQQNLDLLNLKWTIKLEVKENPWTIRFGKYLGNANFLCITVIVYYFVVLVAMEAVLVSNHNNFNSWSYQGLIVFFYGFFVTIKVGEQKKQKKTKDEIRYIVIVTFGLFLVMVVMLALTKTATWQRYIIVNFIAVCGCLVLTYIMCIW
ncbi:hypothetical protein RFI_10730, partial [Reticulomyxa filosa]